MNSSEPWAIRVARRRSAANTSDLLRPCSSAPNLPNCGDHRQGGYTDRTGLRAPHEPNESVAAPTVGVR